MHKFLFQKCHFFEYRVQNKPQNSSKTLPLGFISKQAKHWAVKKTLNSSFVHQQKTEHSFELSLPSVSFHGKFLTLKCETLVLKTATWDVSLLSHLYKFLSRLHFFTQTM